MNLTLIHTPIQHVSIRSPKVGTTVLAFGVGRQKVKSLFLANVKIGRIVELHSGTVYSERNHKLIREASFLLLLWGSAFSSTMYLFLERLPCYDVSG